MCLERFTLVTQGVRGTIFEKEDGHTFVYTGEVPNIYKEGDVIQVFVCQDITPIKLHFIRRDDEEMQKREEIVDQLIAERMGIKLNNK